MSQREAYTVLQISGPGMVSLIGDRVTHTPVLPVVNTSEYDQRRAQQAASSARHKAKQNAARIAAELEQWRTQP